MYVTSLGVASLLATAHLPQLVEVYDRGGRYSADADGLELFLHDGVGLLRLLHLEDPGGALVGGLGLEEEGAAGVDLGEGWGVGG